MRVAILINKAHAEGSEMPEEVAFFVAKNVRSNVRELEGALRKILAYSRFNQKEISIQLAREALRDCRKWNLPYVSINLSSRQFLRHNVGERILRYAADADVSPHRVQIELTETAIIDDVERASYNLRILREAGVRVALDDFGTGYSSLVYLKQFAIDCIKIDKSFVDNIARERQSAVIVASVAKLAKSLGMSVVAEGVETEDQRTILMASGCNMLQGFHFGRPMAAAELAPGHLSEPKY